MPVTTPLPRLPHPSVPLVDDQGRMSRDWYAFFQALMRVLEIMRVTIP